MEPPPPPPPPSLRAQRQRAKARGGFTSSGAWSERPAGGDGAAAEGSGRTPALLLLFAGAVSPRPHTHTAAAGSLRGLLSPSLLLPAPRRPEAGGGCGAPEQRARCAALPSPPLREPPRPGVGFAEGHPHGSPGSAWSLGGAAAQRGVGDARLSTSKPTATTGDASAARSACGRVARSSLRKSWRGQGRPWDTVPQSPPSGAPISSEGADLGSLEQEKRKTQLERYIDSIKEARTLSLQGRF
ncbi:uncharacterized protein LOC143840265 [Paroedura picta]|uniref:uncharacterized protein LOC143840265 n=1 Tax=Paroedura picta TaxID=143630 RepID=UPI004055ED98